ncbi:hypothetical protein D4764_21G0005990 [Takifugu flavidus]|uniref:Uncharacterized protein n=1 Tax=Takifugu flavidus TaxID=433684 RepID=A0A5C6NGG3_9TELE|nr:hypothetical protein D4764_21G0005990 [Takifugu flavidus]
MPILQAKDDSYSSDANRGEERKTRKTKPEVGTSAKSVRCYFLGSTAAAGCLTPPCDGPTGGRRCPCIPAAPGGTPASSATFIGVLKTQKSIKTRSALAAVATQSLSIQQPTDALSSSHHSRAPPNSHGQDCSRAVRHNAAPATPPNISITPGPFSQAGASASAATASPGKPAAALILLTHAVLLQSAAAAARRVTPVIFAGAELGSAL